LFCDFLHPFSGSQYAGLCAKCLKRSAVEGD
jgi:hypothetical protein